MRPALLVVASLLAGCREGVELEILADGKATRVEVFLSAHDPLVEVTALAPEGAERIAGTVYARNLTPDGAIEPRFEATVDGNGRAQLALEPDGDHAVLTALIAIGFDADDAVVSAAVLNDVDVSAAPLRVVVELAPVSGGVLDARAASAQVWARPEYAGAGCVGITTVDPTTGAPATQFIVTEGDPDCDRLTRGLDTEPPGAETECAPFEFQGKADPTAEVLSPVGATCRPVATQCVDGVGVVSGQPLPICLPDAVCTACPGQAPGSCLPDLRTDLEALAFLRCTVPVQEQPDVDGRWPLCTVTSAFSLSDLGGLFNSTVSCDSIEFATLAPSAAPLAYSNKLVLASGSALSSPATLAQVQVTAASPSSRCVISVMTTTTSVGAEPPPRQLARIHASNDLDLLLPVRVELEKGCAGAVNPIRCAYETGVGAQADGIEVCARTP